MKSIKELDEYCRLYDKRVIVRSGQYCGLSNRYYLGKRGIPK